MSTGATKPTDDALQRRIARFVADTPASNALNSYLGLSAGTELGQSRKDNQDRAIAITASYSYAPERNFSLCVVCDGIGGMAYGAEAAVLALSTFASQVIRTTTVHPNDRLERALQRANDAVYDRFRGNSGTTLSSVLLTNELATYCINAGDSRVYGVSKDRSLVPLTRDDTLGAYRQNLQNKFSGLEGHLIQYVGMGDDFEPKVEQFLKDEYNAIFLSTDGIHSAHPSILDDISDRTPNTSDLPERLLTLSRLLGGRDNATIVCIDGQFQQRPPAEQGLTLILLSPFDRLEVWIPTPTHENKQEQLPEALTEASDTRASYTKPKQQMPKRRRLKPLRKSSIAGAQRKLLFGKSAAEKNDNSGDENKTPELNIKFSNDPQD